VQIFLDRIFQSLSQRDSLDIAKFRLRKANEDRGGAAFADYVRTPVMLVEKTFDGAGVSGEQERHNSAPFMEFRA